MNLMQPPSATTFRMAPYGVASRAPWRFLAGHRERLWRHPGGSNRSKAAPHFLLTFSLTLPSVTATGRWRERRRDGPHVTVWVYSVGGQSSAEDPWPDGEVRVVRHRPFIDRRVFSTKHSAFVTDHDSTPSSYNYGVPPKLCHSVLAVASARMK